MSKLSDYSKFDHLESSSDEEEEDKASKTRQPHHPVASSSSPARPQMEQPLSATTNASTPTATTAEAVIRRHPTNSKRFVFEHANQPIYEFEQSLNEVVLYVPAPTTAGIVCNISAQHLQLGLKQADRFFLDEDTGGAVDTTESTWCLEDDENGAKQIVIYLQKMAKGLVWTSALTGRFDAKIDPLSLQQVQKEIMLERFQEEHPGMDFRDAEFNGSVPDPRDFMGGVSY